MSLESWEVIKTKKWSYSRKDMESALRAALSASALKDMFDEDPKLFNFETMSMEHKVLLLKEDFKTFKKHINVAELPKDYIVALFISRPADFKQYIDFEKLSRKQRGEIAVKRPGYIVRYGFPTKGINGEGWIRLLNNNPTEFIPRFVNDIDSFRNKTELRTLLTQHPEVLPHLTDDAMKSSVLTAKEWALFLMYKEFEKQSVRYSDEVNEWLEQEISVEVLMGESNSNPLKKALDKVRNPCKLPYTP